MLLGLLVHIPELRVPVGMLGTLLGLEGALQRVALLLEQPPDGVVGDLEPLPGKGVGELAGRLARPPQRRLGVPAGVRVDQLVQGLQQARVTLGQPLGPPPGRRMRPPGSGGSSSSRTPAYTVGRDSPLTLAMRAPPPCPSARAAAPASRRRCFSVRWGATSSYSPPSTASTSTPGTYRTGTLPPQLSDKLVMRGPLIAQLRHIGEPTEVADDPFFYHSTSSWQTSTVLKSILATELTSAAPRCGRPYE
jgi:hypothetical protein